VETDRGAPAVLEREAGGELEFPLDVDPPTLSGGNRWGDEREKKVKMNFPDGKPAGGHPIAGMFVVFVQ
jgi:hypothetical protein